MIISKLMVFNQLQSDFNWIVSGIVLLLVCLEGTSNLSLPFQTCSYEQLSICIKISVQQVGAVGEGSEAVRVPQAGTV